MIYVAPIAIYQQFLLKTLRVLRDRTEVKGGEKLTFRFLFMFSY